MGRFQEMERSYEARLKELQIRLETMQLELAKKASLPGEEKYQKLLEQLQVLDLMFYTQIERNNNKQFSIYLKQFQQKRDEDVNSLSVKNSSLEQELEDEKAANHLLHESMDHLNESVKQSLIPMGEAKELDKVRLCCHFNS